MTLVHLRPIEFEDFVMAIQRATDTEGHYVLTKAKQCDFHDFACVPIADFHFHFQCPELGHTYKPYLVDL